jgi:hypothetical protein
MRYEVRQLSLSLSVPGDWPAHAPAPPPSRLYKKGYDESSVMDGGYGVADAESRQSRANRFMYTAWPRSLPQLIDEPGRSFDSLPLLSHSHSHVSPPTH